MVVNNLIHHLAEAGFSEYEARAYVALLRSGGQMSAYEVARSAGIPTPKVYGVVARLAERGVLSVSGEGNRKKYAPMDAEEFVEGLRGRINNTLTQIEGGLMSLDRGAPTASILGIRDHAQLIEKAQRMIKSARRSLLVSLWPGEMGALLPRLREAEARMIKISLVHFGTSPARAGQMFYHPVEGSTHREGAARGLVVVSDSREALVGTVLEYGQAEGAMSTNRGFVAMAEEYVRHDIYILKLMRRYDRDFRRMFGQGYEKLTDVFADESNL